MPSTIHRDASDAAACPAAGPIARLGGLALALALAGAVPDAAQAAEGGAGFYLLGSKGPAAAVMPPAGLYFQNDVYFYSGSLGGATRLPSGGRLAVGVDGKAAFVLPTLLWVAPGEVLGGSLGLSVTLPLGWKETAADLTLEGPLGGAARADVQDDTLTLGDPILGGMLGWSRGNLHWQVGTLINVPIGDYQDGQLSNVAFHHWGIDLYTGMTWLDPGTGLDISGVVGVTFNAETPPPIIAPATSSIWKRRCPRTSARPPRPGSWAIITTS